MTFQPGERPSPHWWKWTSKGRCRVEVAEGRGGPGTSDAHPPRVGGDALGIQRGLWCLYQRGPVLPQLCSWALETNALPLMSRLLRSHSHLVAEQGCTWIPSAGPVASPLGQVRMAASPSHGTDLGLVLWWYLGPCNVGAS